MSDLDKLLALLTTSIHDLQAIHTKSKIPFPALDTDIFAPGPLDGDAAALQATGIIVAAAAQIIALVRSPVTSVLDSAFGMYQAASVAVAERLHVAEILHAAGPEGLHVRDIGRIAGTTESDKLGRYLRYLATRHIFREVAPDVFANNRLSSCLDTGKTIDEIRADPDAKYEGQRGGFVALVGHSTDEGLRGAPHMPLELLSASDALSQEPQGAPFIRVACSDGDDGNGAAVPYWEWIERPGNERYLRRFGAVMAGTKGLFPDNVVLTGFDWKTLKKGDLVIDVGGGIGVSTLVLARAFPGLRFVVQDRPKVVQEGIKFFKAECPAALASGQVSFQAHDFFTPQPAASPAVFFVRNITHDWPKPYVQTILRHLRAAASPSTRVVLADFIAPYAARPDENDEAHAAIPGAADTPVPAPLLPNLGLSAAGMYNLDMQMLNILNAQERTVGQFLDMIAGTGWKLERIYRSPQPHLELSPIPETQKQV